jgi:predicted component of type VI protein secretion system
MPTQLLALTDGPSILLDKPILLLGRHGECDVQLNSRKVSRRHCCIAQVNDYLVVRDLGSTNGIRINGQRVGEGQLRAGDELTVGNFRYQVYLEGSSVKEHQHTPSSPPLPPLRSKVKAPPEDAGLESADEPVPLDDATAAGGPILPARPVPPPVRTSDEDSIVLPEILRNPPPPTGR